jgi:hypothetical protein
MRKRVLVLLDENSFIRDGISDCSSLIGPSVTSMLVSKDKVVNLSTRGDSSFKEMGFEHQCND